MPRRPIRTVLVALAGVLLAAGGGTYLAVRPGEGGTTKTPTGAAAHPTLRDRRAARRPEGPGRTELRPVGTSRLAAAVQDASAAADGRGRVALLGGLTARDLSTDSIVVVDRHGSVRRGVLPAAVHDAAAVRAGRFVYLFGGGDGTRQHREIVRVDPRTGATRVVGSLPSPSSDQAAALIGGTAYVVGGFDGTSWLSTIVAWRPRSRAHVVARLPTPVRYAAVAAANGRLVIAGGSLPDGSASRAIFAYTPGSGRFRRIGRLPAPITHAAAAAIGPTVYVLGGRGSVAGTPVSRIVAVAGGRVRPAGRLPTPLSDLAAVSDGGGIVVAGGRSPAGTATEVTWLRPTVVRAAASRSRSAVPASLSRTNVYAADRRGDLRGAARLARPLVYVPNSQSDSVDVIDPRTYRVVEHFAVGGLPQHVVPAYDLKRLYVTNDAGNSLTVIDPRTGRPGRTIPVDDPYNMYFTPDGRFAIVVAERLHRLDFRDAHSFRLRDSLAVPCAGIDHVDFSADGSYLVASCEFSGQLVEVDVRRRRIVATLTLPAPASPQDVKLSPDGSTFYVADKARGGVWEVTGRPLRATGFLRTGLGAHGLYVSRDTRLLYVTNRAAGSISVVSFRTRTVVATWRIPGGGSPDMGGVSADGRVLWLSGRYDGQVYALSTADGKLLARIDVGRGPHGLCVWPQPGRYSLGHTGILR